MGDGMSYIETNGYFVFGAGQYKSSDYGVWLNGGGTYNAPARRYRTFDVPGRNGSLTIDEGAFAEIEHVYPAFIASNYRANIESLRNVLMQYTGKQRLSDSYHTDEFYLARYMDGLEAETAPGGKGGSFDIRFVRDPRRFLTSGETVTTITASSGTITNPTLYESRPLIKVTGYGTLTIGGENITIASGQTYVTIDSELMDCYMGTTNKNDKVTFAAGKFPTLKAGSTGISRSGNITKIEITPRWYRL